MREVPLRWSGPVITVSPPAARTAAAIPSSSVATATRPMSASIARRQTWTIIGVAVDVGERLARQAGRRHAGRDEDDACGLAMGIRARGTAAEDRAFPWGKRSQSRALIRVASRRGKLVVSPPTGCGRSTRACGRGNTRADEFRIQQGRRRGARHGAWRHGGRHRGGDDLRAAARPEARLRHRGRRAGGGEEGPGGPATPRSRRSPTGFRPRASTNGTDERQEMPDLPHLREGRARTRSARISGAWSAPTSFTRRTSTIPTRCRPRARRA